MHEAYDTGWCVHTLHRLATKCVLTGFGRAELNAECTKFVNEHGRTLDKEQFDAEYPFEI